MQKLNRSSKLLFKLLPNSILIRVLPRLKKFRFLVETQNTQTPINFTLWYRQKVMGHCEDCYWPVHPNSTVTNPKNVYCGIETSPGFSFGNYIQAMDKIYVGDYTQIAPNVGIITGNHELHDNRKHITAPVHIGQYCWIGMGAIVLPGVTLGDYTIVAAGSIVTKSFPDGFCVIGGNPARVLKTLDKDKCILHKSDYEYNGYIPHREFEEFRKKHLNV